VTQITLTPELVETLAPQDRDMARRILRRKLVATHNGNAWRISGFGVEVLTVELHYLMASDLKPPPRSRR
jgi:hypothetical protein